MNVLGLIRGESAETEARAGVANAAVALPGVLLPQTAPAGAQEHAAVFYEMPQWAKQLYKQLKLQQRLSRVAWAGFAGVNQAAQAAAKTHGPACRLL